MAAQGQDGPSTAGTDQRGHQASAGPGWRGVTRSKLHDVRDTPVGDVAGWAHPPVGRRSVGSVAAVAGLANTWGIEP